MLLSKLVYISVKETIYLDNEGFTYEAFKRGEFNNDPDYSTNIINAYSPINEAIQRLTDLNKLPRKTFNLGKNIVQLIDLGALDETLPIKEITHFFQIFEGDYRTIAFNHMGDSKYLLTDSVFDGVDLYIEYIQDIEILENFIGDNDIDLKEKYGINAAMCQYIKEYAQGKLLEQIDPAQANLHISRAEQYFQDLPNAANTFEQNRIECKFRIN